MPNTLLTAVALVLAASVAGAATVCDEARAVQSARAVTADYCARVAHGCDFKVRADDTAGERERATIWLVKVSQIHSFGPDGAPRVMPEGAVFVRVGRQVCGVLGILAHEGEQPIPPNTTGKAMCEEQGGTWGRFGLLQRDECNLPRRTR
ncbi:MAG: hypothetical protein AMXMBFR72_11330 [Betaproteobacteria bacterium]